MNFLRSTFALITLVCCFSTARGQQNLFYNHYFINPSLYNPSFTGSNGYSELFLNYRKQWSGVEGAPSTGTLNLHLPLNYKTSVGITAAQDKAGLIRTTTGMVSFAYHIYLGKTIKDLHKIGFGLAAGITNSRLDGDLADDVNDPVLGTSTSSMDGQFGMHYQYNHLKLAFAIPRLFDAYVASENEFNEPGFTQINNTISSLSYEWKFGRVSVEPTIMYRTFNQFAPQLEGLGVVRFENIGWIGASFRQEYGGAAFFGLQVKEKIKVGYAYEFATRQTDRFGDGSHEVQLIVRLGKKQFTPPGRAPKSAGTPTVATEEEGSDEEKETHEDYHEEGVAGMEAMQPRSYENEGTMTWEQPVVEEASNNRRPSDLSEALEGKTEPVKLNGDGMAPGHYVVVGAFQSVLNAKNYSRTLKRAGYPASVAYHPGKGYYIVHMVNASTIEEAREQRDRYRQLSRYSFRDTWILSIE